jgi:hypothetical protein
MKDWDSKFNLWFVVALHVWERERRMSWAVSCLDLKQIASKEISYMIESYKFEKEKVGSVGDWGIRAYLFFLRFSERKKSRHCVLLVWVR